jgi:hypothetical protein
VPGSPFYIKEQKLPLSENVGSEAFSEFKENEEYVFTALDWKELNQRSSPDGSKKS